MGGGGGGGGGGVRDIHAEVQKGEDGWRDRQRIEGGREGG